MVKDKATIIKDLIESHLRSCDFIERLAEIGITIRPSDATGSNIFNSALDLIGFPVDTTVNADPDTWGTGFCRDYLTPDFENASEDFYNEAIPVSIRADRYYEWLCNEYKKLNDESEII